MAATVALGDFLATQDDPGTSTRIVTNITGWNDAALVRSDLPTRAGQDGSYDAAPLYGSRVITLEGTVIAADHGAAMTVADALAGLDLHSQITLIVDDPIAGSRSAQTRLTSGVIVTWHHASAFDYSVQVTAWDPRRYGLAHVDSLGAPGGVVVGAGRVWPRAWPRDRAPRHRPRPART